MPVSSLSMTRGGALAHTHWLDGAGVDGAASSISECSAAMCMMLAAAAILSSSKPSGPCETTMMRMQLLALKDDDAADKAKG